MPKSDQTTIPDPNTAQLNAVSNLRIPPFWDEQPDVWFIVVENQFGMHRTIDDDAKYSHVLAALPQNIILTVTDVIRNPPLGTKYDTLKAALIKRHSISAEKQLDELLSGFHTMGDLGPSQYYRLLEGKAGDSRLINKDLLKNLWLKRLPETLRTAVAAWVDRDIAEILPIADQIWVFAQPSTSNIAEAHRQPSTSKATIGGGTDLARIQQQLDQTQQQLKDLQKTMANMSLGRRRSPARTNSFTNRSRSRSNPRSGFCYYHQRFGPRARTCQRPCTYRKGEQHGTNPKQSKPSENY